MNSCFHFNLKNALCYYLAVRQFSSQAFTYCDSSLGVELALSDNF